MSRSFVVVATLALLIAVLTLTVIHLTRGFDLALSHENIVASDDDKRYNPRKYRRRERNAYADKRIPSVVRSGIEVPLESRDSVKCDELLSRGRPKECLISEGPLACFDCTESRTFARACVHFDDDVTLHNDRTGDKYRIARNIDSDVGYCVSTTIAMEMRDLVSFENVKRRCVERNGHWLLVRRVASRDASVSTYNFICRCKYPHLLTNIDGPTTECARDVACNGHGRLDEDSTNGRVDPFLYGRCECDDGWLSARNDSVGPYCREATFEEWPSRFFGESRPKNDIEYIALHDERISRAFAARIERNRLDDRARSVMLPNPCTTNGCSLERTPDGRWFCGDRVTFANEGYDRSPMLDVSIGVRRDRDYLAGNGGTLPNSCLRLRSVDSKVVLLQFLSQSWNAKGERYSQEMGFVTSVDELDRVFDNAEWRNNAEYERFLRDTVRPLDPTYEKSLDRGVVWTYADPALSEHRERFNESFGVRLTPAYTHLGEGTLNGASYMPVPYYFQRLGINFYGLYPRLYERIPNELLIQPVYECPDDRGGIDKVDETKAYVHGRLDNYHSAVLHARRISPICLARRKVRKKNANLDTSVLTPEINCRHPNDSACVAFHFGNRDHHGYSFFNGTIMSPRISMLRFCGTRAIPRPDDVEKEADDVEKEVDDVEKEADDVEKEADDVEKY